MHCHFTEGLILASLRGIEWGGVLKSESDAEVSEMESLRKSLIAKQDTLNDVDKQMGNLVNSIASVGINVHLNKMLSELTIEHEKVTEDMKVVKDKYEDLKARQDSKEADTLSISQTISTLSSTSDVSTRLRMNAMLKQHLSKIVASPDPLRFTVYDKQENIIATITPHDIHMKYAHIVTPNLEWDFEQHFQSPAV
jgi:chromosome segregation ATPase